MRDKVRIIAEIGVNFNGQLKIAYELIDAAKDAGVDAVKFQTSVPDKMISRFAEKADYQFSSTDPEQSQLEMAKKLALPFDYHVLLKKYTEDKDLEFISSPFDIESIIFLDRLGLECLKIPSGEITNLPYLRHIGSLRKQIILSSGMSTMQEVGNALDILINAGTAKQNITVLHANTMYPTPMEDVNLNAMLAIQKEFDVAVGYSDHTLGIEVDIAAVAIGASVIEKHFTLDNTMDGPDHKASLEPKDFKLMVDSIRNIEKSLGDGIKKPSQSEFKNIAIVRKSIVAICKIKRGEIFSEKNIGTKRPGTGISPMLWNDVIGKTAKKDFLEDEIISL